MVSILFWNVAKKNLGGVLCSLAMDTTADVLVLCEDVMDPIHTLEFLRDRVDKSFFIPSSIALRNRFSCFCRTPSFGLGEVNEGFRTSTRRMNFQSAPVLLGVVHGVDMRNYDQHSRQSEAEKIAREFRYVIERQKNERMIIVGDFNLNPFDAAMNLPRGFNAMMTRDCVRRGSRKFQEESFGFFLQSHVESIWRPTTRAALRNGIRHEFPRAVRLEYAGSGTGSPRCSRSVSRRHDTHNCGWSLVSRQKWSSGQDIGV